LKFIQVREKRAEFVLLKCTFVRRAAEFLRNYFPSLIDSMLNDKSNFSQVKPSPIIATDLIFGSKQDLWERNCRNLQKGQLQRPDHADMRYKCRKYARLLQFIKVTYILILLQIGND
jgi:hypothetical protein